MSVIIETSIGDFTVDLYTDERPRCCLNFLKLCKVKYYNFSLFHSVQENLVAQVGDPTATGRGGDSIFAHLYGEQARFFDMEVIPRLKHTKQGLISMVNNGSGMHGSQFFVTLADDLDYLDGKHTVFGEVAEGFDLIDKLNKTFCDDIFRPHQDIRIYHTVILDDPYDDPDGLQIPDASPGPTREMLDSDRIPCDADVNADEGKTEEELAEMMAEKEANANTQILEMVGDLPEAEVAPPENVLFVCKLNPVTTSDDLEIIFSRFGTIVSCEVIKDAKTGESLQYAFIEFSCQPECENAYFKMDNVLIDDRRVHVDFSQSVSKLKWKGKGKGVEIDRGGNAPAFILKNQQRQDDRYDLVYDHADDEDKSNGNEANNLKKKKKDKERSKISKRSNDSEDERDERKQKQKKLSESPEDRGRRQDSRSYRDNRQNTERQRSGKHDDSKERPRGSYNYNEDERSARDSSRSEYSSRRDRYDDRRSRGDELDNNYRARKDYRDGDSSRRQDRDSDYRPRQSDKDNSYRQRVNHRADYPQSKDEGRWKEADRYSEAKKGRSRSPVSRNDYVRKRSCSSNSEDNRGDYKQNKGGKKRKELDRTVDTRKRSRSPVSRNYPIRRRNSSSHSEDDQGDKHKGSKNRMKELDRNIERKRRRSKSPASRNDSVRGRSRSDSSNEGRAFEKKKRKRSDSRDRQRARGSSSEYENKKSNSKSNSKEKIKNGKVQKITKRSPSTDSLEESTDEDRKKSYKKNKKKKTKKRESSSSDNSEDGRKRNVKDSSSSDESVKPKKKKKKGKSKR